MRLSAKNVCLKTLNSERISAPSNMPENECERCVKPNNSDYAQFEVEMYGC